MRGVRGKLLRTGEFGCAPRDCRGTLGTCLEGLRRLPRCNRWTAQLRSVCCRRPGLHLSHARQRGFQLRPYLDVRRLRRPTGQKRGQLDAAHGPALSLPAPSQCATAAEGVQAVCRFTLRPSDFDELVEEEFFRRFLGDLLNSDPCLEEAASVTFRQDHAGVVGCRCSACVRCGDVGQCSTQPCTAVSTGT